MPYPAAPSAPARSLPPLHLRATDPRRIIWTSPRLAAREPDHHAPLLDALKALAAGMTLAGARVDLQAARGLA